jgi:ribonuclease P protein component
MTVKYSFHPKRKNPRIAIVISKKVIKGAVGRNRVRRRLYEVMRHELPHLKRNSDVVLIVFAGEVLTIPAQELTATVKQLLSETGVYESDDDSSNADTSSNKG